MYTAVIVIHIIVCVFLVLSVLLQKGKGAEIGAVFGSSEALFGSTGPITFLNKMTTVVAVIFMITSLTLTYLSAHKGSGSVMEGVSAPKPVTAPPATKTQPQMPVPPVVPNEASKASAPGQAAAPAPAAVTDGRGKASKGDTPRGEAESKKH